LLNNTDGLKQLAQSI